MKPDSEAQPEREIEETESFRIHSLRMAEAQRETGMDWGLVGNIGGLGLEPA
jgi:hypothetical protein